MTGEEPFGQWGRLAVAVVLLVALVGLMGWYGTLGPAPDEHRYPDVNAVGPAPEEFVGDRVVLAGRVIATDPVTIRTGHPDGTRTVVVENADATVLNVDRPVRPGDNVAVFGTLVAPDTLEPERTVVREPWENLYMFGVSLLAGLWVLGRFLLGFGFDREGYAFVPRERSLGKWAIERVTAVRTGEQSPDGGR